MLQRHVDPALIPHRARLFESLGFDDVWVVEDRYFSGGIAQAGGGAIHDRAVGRGDREPPSRRAEPGVRGNGTRDPGRHLSRSTDRGDPGRCLTYL